MLSRKAKRRQTEKDAEHILAQSFDTLRSHQPGDITPMSFLKTRLEAKAAQQAVRKDSVMSKATTVFTTRPKTLVTAAVAVLAFLFVTLVPFSYMVTVGYAVSFNEPSPEAIGDPNQLVAAMSALGYDNVTANYNSNDAGTGMICTISGLPDRQAANTAVAAYRTLTGNEVEPTITPVLKQVSGSLYAQVKDQLQQITISIDEAASAEEIEAQIQAQLIAQGFEPANVHVITSEEDGTVTIDLEIGE